ncbi:hypothetical protein ABZ916_39235 [Streptomyces sp. NPDC046853]|uniref:hypothetical protein n=1 Tax=Streptomyces sp. NPDC046853 TaxID=3154920 RepID=UPI0033F7F0FC
MNQPPSDRLPDHLAGQRQIVPAHHRPPNVMYAPDGTPYHFTIGQAPQPQQITLNMPEQSGMSPQQREFMMYVVMWLVVAVVLCGCICGVVVICGGTLMGIIGTVSANIPMVGLTVAGVILAAGWAATKIRPGKKE